MRILYPVSILLILVALLGGCAAESSEKKQAKEEASATTASTPAQGEGTDQTTECPAVVPDPTKSPEGSPTTASSSSTLTESQKVKMLSRPKMVASEPSGTEPLATESPATETPPTEDGKVMRFAYAPELAEDQATPPTEAKVIQDEGTYTVVQIFYGTDRKKTVGVTSHPLGRIPWQQLTLATGAATLLVFLVSCLWIRRKKAFLVSLVLLMVTAGFWSATILIPRNTKPDIARTDIAYGGDRGALELGTCEVSIPKHHKLAELESPSILHFEITENPEKHVVLLGIDPMEESGFVEKLRDTVEKSEGHEAFVFIHGYNVTFEDAARRTAQLAYDLNFKGAPILFSWPSQGGLFNYMVDENNVVWTVPNLKQFLQLVAKQSGAKRVHLIAHSMGNRALASALEKISYTDAKEGPIFNEVVLTAPDIDAEIFRRDLAPRIVKTAQHVTLYASSNDKALIASKKVHGSPRAGESGKEQVVVVPGIDTIDVSVLDTSLLGHSYYGSNNTVLIDLAQLLLESKPPTLRKRLQAKTINGLSYWVFFLEKLPL